MSKNASPWLKMQVLGAVEFAEGKTIRERIVSVSKKAFRDEDGVERRFTWRTISTWLYRYKSRGVTEMESKERSDKGRSRKVRPECVQEAIDQVLPQFNGTTYNKTQIYRACIEQGLLRREEIAPNTFSRMVNRHEMLKPIDKVTDKRRLAFSKKHANQMWQFRLRIAECGLRIYFFRLRAVLMDETTIDKI